MTSRLGHTSQGLLIATGLVNQQRLNAWFITSNLDDVFIDLLQLLVCVIVMIDGRTQAVA